MIFAEDDFAFFVGEVLARLKRLTDKEGKYILLSPDEEILILAAAITATNNARDDTELFKPLIVT